MLVDAKCKWFCVLKADGNQQNNKFHLLKVKKSKLFGVL